MPLTRERKEELIAEYADILEQSRAIILTEYRGLDNQSMTRLRRAVHEAGGVYRVAKLTLLQRALEASGYALPEGLSGAPIALGFCLEEIPSVAKALVDYAGESEILIIRGALLRDQFLSGKQVEALASLPPLEVLLAQILGLIQAPAANLVGVAQSGVSQIVDVLNARVEQGAPAE